MTAQNRLERLRKGIRLGPGGRKGYAGPKVELDLTAEFDAAYGPGEAVVIPLTGAELERLERQLETTYGDKTDQDKSGHTAESG